MSLDVQGDRLHELGRVAESIERVGESLAKLLPYLQRHPQVHSNRARINLRDYEERCASIDKEPDRQLVEQVRAALVDETQ